MLYLHAQMQFPYRLYTLIALRLHAGPVKPAFIIFVQHQIGEPAQRRIEDGFIMADMLLLDLGNLQIDRPRHRVSGPIAAVHVIIHRLLFGRKDSEEHTSELQSLMRISYAVFCLKKTKFMKYTNHLSL